MAKKATTRRKWYNFETMFTSLKEELRIMLHSNDIKFELSDGRTWAGAPARWHFEIYASNKEVDIINKWLDENTINEKTA